ncbi:MAG: DNA-3-methyladenine glycosylase 2 family protein [Roseiarcus sp.]
MSGNLPRKGGGGKSGGGTRAKARPKRAASAKKAPKTAPARRVRRPTAPPVHHSGPLIDCESALEEAVARLIALDPEIVGKLIEIGGAPPLRRQEPGFVGMARIIISQQLSTASANAIFKRLEAAVAPLDAQGLIAADDEKLRACGLSTAKIRALRALAQAVARDGLDLTGLGALGAGQAHQALVAIKGVGPWTADIFLLFCLGHPDSFPAGDLALQEAARLALGLKERPNARRLEEIAERWRPLRGVAARMLWAYYRMARKRVGMALESPRA